jgi:hypothetical protein
MAVSLRGFGNINILPFTSTLQKIIAVTHLNNLVTRGALDRTHKACFLTGDLESKRASSLMSFL